MPQPYLIGDERWIADYLNNLQTQPIIVQNIGGGFCVTAQPVITGIVASTFTPGTVTSVPIAGGAATTVATASVNAHNPLWIANTIATSPTQNPQAITSITGWSAGAANITITSTNLSNVSPGNAVVFSSLYFTGNTESLVLAVPVIPNQILAGDAPLPSTWRPGTLIRFLVDGAITAGGSNATNFFIRMGNLGTTSDTLVTFSQAGAAVGNSVFTQTAASLTTSAFTLVIDLRVDLLQVPGPAPVAPAVTTAGPAGAAGVLSGVGTSTGLASATTTTQVDVYSGTFISAGSTSTWTATSGASTFMDLTVNPGTGQSIWIDNVSCTIFS